MLCEYSHTKSESLAQIHTIMADIQYFSRRLFFLLSHPVDVVASLNALIDIQSSNAFENSSSMNADHRLIYAQWTQGTQIRNVISTIFLSK